MIGRFQFVIDAVWMYSLIYFDFAKAFDSVSHPKLVHKLDAYEICGNLLAILTDFLSERSQRVALSNAASTFLPVTALYLRAVSKD